MVTRSTPAIEETEAPNPAGSRPDTHVSNHGAGRVAVTGTGFTATVEDGGVAGCSCVVVGAAVEIVVGDGPGGSSATEPQALATAAAATKAMAKGRRIR
ncbi:MAG: hypothetical protein ACE5GC_04330 [Acidimicrobiia bacterium]